MTLRLLLVLLLAGGPLLAGCAAPVIIAAGVGTGYVMTDDRSRRKVDRFFQDLSRSVRQTTRRLSGDRPARRSSASGRKTDFTLRVRKTTLTPATVGKGATVTVTLQYALSGGPGGGSRVEVQRSLLREGKRLTVLNTETATRENGTWENTLTFAVPDSARPGRYAVRQEISARGLTRTTERGFTVR
jgi:hypothetical protein